VIRLQVSLDSGDSFERDFDGESVTLGRSPKAGLPLPDRYLSREHARISVRDGVLLVEDLGSRNGTFVNGVRIEERTLVEPGDRLRLSNCTVTIAGAAGRAGDDEPRQLSEERLGAPSLLVPASDLSVLRFDPDQTVLEDEDLDRHFEQLRLLDDVHRALAGPISLEGLLEMILDRLFEHLAPEEGVVILARDGGVYERVAQRLAPGLDSATLYSQTLIEEVAGKRQAALVLDAQADGRFAAAESIMASGVRSIVAAPLTVENSSLGMIALSSRVNVRQFTERDLELLVSLASVAALRLDNVILGEAAAERRKLEAEVALARSVQESLLTHTIPEVPGYELFALNHPSQGVSGDLYQVVQTDRLDRFFLFLFDVSGKGLAASILTATIEALAAGLIAQDLPPERICSLVSDLLERRTLPDRFATAFLARLDTTTHVLTYTNAGHNPALLVHAGGGVERLPRTGLPFAVLAGSPYASKDVEMTAGDLLVVYSDGFTEAMSLDGEEYGLDRLEAVCAASVRSSCAGLARSIETSVSQFALGRPFDDDQTLLLLRRDGKPA